MEKPPSTACLMLSNLWKRPIHEKQNDPRKLSLSAPPADCIPFRGAAFTLRYLRPFCGRVRLPPFSVWDSAWTVMRNGRNGMSACGLTTIRVHVRASSSHDIDVLKLSVVPTSVGRWAEMVSWCFPVDAPCSQISKNGCVSISTNVTRNDTRLQSTIDRRRRSRAMSSIVVVGADGVRISQLSLIQLSLGHK